MAEERERVRWSRRSAGQTTVTVLSCDPCVKETPAAPRCVKVQLENVTCLPRRTSIDPGMQTQLSKVETGLLTMHPA